MEVPAKRPLAVVCRIRTEFACPITRRWLHLDDVSTKIGKRQAYKLVIYLKSGENRIDFIDCKSHLEVKWQGLVNGNMFESYFRDYREVKGLQYAFEIDSGNQKIVLDKVEVNPKLDAARFSKP